TTAAGIQTATVSVDTTPIRVSDIQVGKSVGADKKVANQTTTFGVRDTMFVAVVTDGAGKGAKLATKWTYNGKTVKEDSQTITPSLELYVLPSGDGQLIKFQKSDGAEGDRTPDLCSAIAALSQLSYSPARTRRTVLEPIELIRRTGPSKSPADLGGAALI